MDQPKFIPGQEVFLVSRAQKSARKEKVDMIAFNEDKQDWEYHFIDHINEDEIICENWSVAFLKLTTVED